MRKAIFPIIIATLAACGGTVSLGGNEQAGGEGASSGYGGPGPSAGKGGTSTHQGGTDNGGSGNGGAASDGGVSEGGSGGALWSVSPDALQPSDGGHAGIPTSNYDHVPNSVAISPTGAVTTAGITRGMYGTTNSPCTPSTGSDTIGDGLVLFYDADGKIVRCASVSSTGDDAVNDVAQDSSGAIDIVGSIGGDAKLIDQPLAFNGEIDLLVAQFDAENSVRWARTFGYEGVQEAFGVAADSSHNVFAVGGFEGTILSGSDILNAVGSRSAFVLKLDKDGTWLWGRSWGSGHAIARAAAASTAGNVSVLGEFDGTIDFGSSQHVSQGSADGFVVTLDPSGQVLWSKAFGNQNAQRVSRIAVDPKGNIAIVGRSTGSIDFGGGSIDASIESVFVAVYGPDGTYRWAAQYGVGADGEAASRTSVALDENGDVIVGGAFSGSVNFGTGTLPYGGDGDVFVAAWSPTGAALWSHSYGDYKSQSLRGLAYDAQGGMALTGLFRGTIDFGSGPLETVPEVGAAFVTRFPPW